MSDSKYNHVKRSERVAALARVLISEPGRLFTLREFADRFDCSKSTTSEDIATIRAVMARYGLGVVESLNGAAGGVRFYPFQEDEADSAFVLSLCELLSDRDRILPGGFLYTVDLFSDPVRLSRMGEILAKHFRPQEPDVVVTVETMGVPIALMVAKALGRPLLTARRDTRITEGSVLTYNYMSTSTRRVETISLPRRSLTPGQRALLIDDFMKGGGTARALSGMMGEFGVDVAGIGVIMATAEPKQKRVRDYRALITLGAVNEEAGFADISPAEWLIPSRKR